MKTRSALPFILPSLLALSPPSPAGETLVQISTIDALLQGIFDGNVTFDELKQHGDFGIGTLDNLDGEMIALDGKFHQIDSKGTVHEIPGNAETPFAAVTFFKSDKTLKLAAIGSLADLQAFLDRKILSGNLFHAVKITGSFTAMDLRSVPRQDAPFRTLTEVVKEQSVFRLSGVSGTLVGFRCPEYVKGINVPGYHFHFISRDGKQGGHVLDCSLEQADVEIDTLENFRMLLPRDGDFLKADFAEHDEKAIEAVEKPSTD